MTDTHQAIYDAVRSRLSNCDVGSAIESALSSAFGSASLYLEHLRESYQIVANEMQRPSVLFKPKLEARGRRWFASYGEDMVGVGKTPSEAMTDFDKHWNENNWEAPQE